MKDPLAVLRVLHFGHCPLPQDVAQAHAGCAGRHPGSWVLNLCRAQNRSPVGLHATLATLVRRLPATLETVLDDVPVHLVASRARARLLRGYRSDRRALRHLADRLQPDILHAHGFENAYALAAQDARRPCVITAQGLMFMILPALRPPWCSWMRILRWHEHAALRKARHVIAKSDTVARALRQRYPHLEIHRIPNTFDPGLTEIRVPRQPRTLVFVGSLDARKGLHLLDAALERIQPDLPDLSLWLVGNRESQASAYEKEQLARLRNRLGDRLKTFGQVPAASVGPIVARATALVAPSLEEMFGNQLIEALLVGTHGIVTEATGLAENARRFGNATVIPQRDSAALAQAILQVLRQTDFPERETARERILAAMGPAAVAAAHRTLYELVRHEPA